MSFAADFTMSGPKVSTKEKSTGTWLLFWYVYTRTGPSAGVDGQTREIEATGSARQSTTGTFSEKSAPGPSVEVTV